MAAIPPMKGNTVSTGELPAWDYFEQSTKMWNTGRVRKHRGFSINNTDTRNKYGIPTTRAVPLPPPHPPYYSMCKAAASFAVCISRRRSIVPVKRKKFTKTKQKCRKCSIQLIVIIDSPFDRRLNDREVMILLLRECIERPLGGEESRKEKERKTGRNRKEGSARSKCSLISKQSRNQILRSDWLHRRFLESRRDFRDTRNMKEQR